MINFSEKRQKTSVIGFKERVQVEMKALENSKPEQEPKKQQNITEKIVPKRNRVKLARKRAQQQIPHESENQPKKRKRPVRQMQKLIKAETVQKLAPIQEIREYENDVIVLADDEYVEPMIVKLTSIKKVVQYYQTSLSNDKIQDLICQLDNTNDLSVLPNFTAAQYTYLLDKKMLKSHDGSDLHKLAKKMRK